MTQTCTPLPAVLGTVVIWKSHLGQILAHRCVENETSGETFFPRMETNPRRTEVN